MKKEDNDWYISSLKFNLDEGEPRVIKISGEEYKMKDENEGEHRVIKINGEEYKMKDENAGFIHAILLLVDAINDKK